LITENAGYYATGLAPGRLADTPIQASAPPQRRHAPPPCRIYAFAPPARCVSRVDALSLQLQALSSSQAARLHVFSLILISFH